MRDSLKKANDSMNDLTRLIVISTVASLAAGWIKKQFFDRGE